MSGKILTTLKFILWRIPVLYLMMFLMANALTNQEAMEYGEMVRTLNAVMPSSYEGLLEISQKMEKVDQQPLKEYFQYYKEIVRFHPDMAEGYGMLGFCYYHLGDHQNAISSYEKAIELHPDFFWYYYNLGIIHFKEGAYEKAIEMFKKGMDTPPESALHFIFNSKLIYMPIVKVYLERGVSAVEQLKAGYKECPQLLLLSYYKLKNSSENVGITEEQINIKPF